MINKCIILLCGFWWIKSSKRSLY